jgi:2-C-methyl-D-erythritol 2,4-cyclodiphosphate synthase
MSSRAGIGFDAHPFAVGRPLRLGGVEIPHEAGLLGHSDGDASLGEYFPDDDRRHEDADSADLLARVHDAARRAGFTVENVDGVVIAEAPRVAPYRDAMRTRIAEVLEVPVDRVNVRGTSSNGLGFPGRREGIAAMAVVLLRASSG